MPQPPPDSPEPPAFDWETFPGLSAPTYTMTPDAIFDWVAPLLSEGELRVLLYIVRRTFGFAKSRDAISIEQLCHGITREDGTRLDLGTGMSRSALMRALRSLREKHLIVAEQQRDTPYGQAPTVYALNLIEAPAWLPGDPRAASGTPPSHQRHSPIPIAALPRAASGSPGVPPLARGADRQRHPQETVVQETVQQQNSSPLPPQRGERPIRRRRRAEEPANYSQGAYGVCPECNSRPHDPDCPVLARAAHAGTS